MRSGRRRLLLVTPHPAWPPTHGWAVRLWNLIRRLSERVEVYPLIFTGGTDDVAQRAALAPYCPEVFFQQFRDPALAEPTLPLPARELVWDGLRERIEALSSAHRIDLLQIEGTEMVGLLPALPGVPVIVTAHDLGFETHFRRLRARLGRYGERSRSHLGFREWLRFARYEISGLARADQIHCMSEANARRLARVSPRLTPRLRVVPNGVDCAAMAPPPGDAASPARRDVLILGSFPHPPNSDAVEYFLSEIWPRVRRELPEARVTLAGASPPDWVLALDGSDGVRVAGEVDDVRPLLWRHAVLAVPLRAGSGTRIKILEAMGAGLPVVSTPVGAAGIAARPGREIELATRPVDFAARLVERLRDPAGGERMAESGRLLVTARYDWRIVAEKAFAAMNELVPLEASPAAQPVDERSEAAASSSPGIELLVPWRRGAALAPGFLDAVAGQDYHLPFRVRFVSTGELPPALAADCARRGIDWIDVGADCATPGAMLDRTISGSRAALIAVLEPGHVPRSPFWLGHLVWALQQPAPPAAVQGERVAPGEAPIEREALAARGAFRFGFSNLAVRRDVWTRLPFGERVDAWRSWPRAIVDSHQFVLSTPDAPVDVVAAREPIDLAPAGDPRPAASVVVCTRDRGAAIETTLAALATQRAPFEWEVVVVDNDSAPQALAEHRRAVAASGERFRLVSEPTAGLSTARNCGVRHTRGDAILFLDDDATPAAGWLAALVEALAEPGVEAAGGPVDPAWEGELPDWLTPELFPYLSAWDRGVEPHDLRYNETPRGTNMGLTRAAFELVGLFSPHLGRKGRSLRSCEEIELFLRLERAGRRIRYVPAARVRHRTAVARLTPEWMEARFAQQGLSEAIVDWMHGGASGLRRGLWRQRREGAVAAPGSIGELRQRFERAASRGYRRGAWIAFWSVPRLFG